MQRPVVLVVLHAHTPVVMLAVLHAQCESGAAPAIDPALCKCIQTLHHGSSNICMYQFVSSCKDNVLEGATPAIDPVLCKHIQTLHHCRALGTGHQAEWRGLPVNDADMAST
eukprot:1156949-Pelagomonas_calceolata.AAC.3